MTTKCCAMDLPTKLYRVQKLLYQGECEAAQSILHTLRKHPLQSSKESRAVLFLLSESYIRVSQFMRASRYLLQVQSHAKQDNDEHDELRAAALLASIANEQSDYLRGLRLANEVIEKADSLEYDEVKALALGIKGDIYNNGHGENGQKVTAMIADIHQSPDDDEIYSLQIQDRKLALGYHTEALHIYTKTRNRYGIAKQKSHIGRVHFNLCDHELALSLFKESKEIFADIGDRLEVSTQKNNIGILSAYNNDFETAVKVLNEAIAMALDAKNFIYASRNQENLAFLYLNPANYNFEKAVQLYKEAIHSLQKVRQHIAGSYEQQEYFIRDLFEVYHELIELLCEEWIRKPRAELLNDIFFYMEHVKAYVLLARANRSEKDVNKAFHLSLDTRSNIKELNQEIDRLRAELYEIWSRQEPVGSMQEQIEKKMLLQNKLDRIWLEELQVRNKIDEHEPAHLPSLDTFISRLAPDEVFISIYQGHDNVYALRISTEQVNLFKLGETHALKKLTARYRERVLQDSYRDRQTYTDDGQLLWNFISANGHIFTSKLEHYFVSSASFLSLVSLDALPLTNDKKAKQFLGLTYSISHVPSASFFLQLKERAATSRSLKYNHDFYGIGVPGISKSTPGYIEMAERNVIKASGFFNKRVLDFNPSKSAVLERLSETYRVIHIVTHGIREADIPGEKDPFLVLSNSTGSGHVEFLTSSDITTRNIPSQLISLAACNTGDGTMIGGEGIHSIARAFLGSRALCIIGSLWEVREDVAEKFMIHFFNCLKTATIQNAFLQARKQVASQAKNAIDWAPFILIGYGNQRIEL